MLLLGALTAIGPFTIDMYLAAFPQITADMGTQPAAVQLTITATLAGLALGQLLIGSISDALGRRTPLIGGMALYIAASLGIVFVQSVEVLTALRFVEGLAASAGMVLSMAIVRDRYHGVQVGKVLARLMLVVGVAPSIAPIIGAQFLLLGSWRIMFVALAGFGVILLLLAIFLLPESLPVERRRSGGIAPALRSYGSLITDPIFMGLALLSGFSMAALFTYVSSATFVFQDGFGLSAQQFALIFASGAVCVTAGTQINGALIGRWAPERILTVGVFAGLGTTGAMLAVSVLGLGMWPLDRHPAADPAGDRRPVAGRAGHRAGGQRTPGRQRGGTARCAAVRRRRRRRADHRAVPRRVTGGDGSGDVRRDVGDGRSAARPPAQPEARPAAAHRVGRIRV